MRRFWWIPTMLIIVACGGSGLNLFFPNTRELAIEFQNNSPDQLDMWVLPETPGATTSLASSGRRTIRQTRIWTREDQVERFIFQCTPPGLALATVEITIDGKESHAENLHGMLVTWDGTRLRAVTR
ncbi:MAG: hypothetical protein IT363_09760 [Methanoregulaceae archaeon]|nr:hypothetical protein [Methanoregulaceae archaeon]